MTSILRLIATAYNETSLLTTMLLTIQVLNVCNIVLQYVIALLHDVSGLRTFVKPESVKSNQTFDLRRDFYRPATFSMENNLKNV